MRETASSQSPSLPDIEGSIAAYPDAEKVRGRIAKHADSQTIALTLVGTVHHLLITNRAGNDLGDSVSRIVVALMGGMRPE
jgi:hypothetical protein